jgi:hypothetical protein
VSAEIVLSAGEAITISVMHTDASVSRVEVTADHTGFNVVIDAQPHIPYGLIQHVTEEEP